MGWDEMREGEGKGWGSGVKQSGAERIGGGKKGKEGKKRRGV